MNKNLSLKKIKTAEKYHFITKVFIKPIFIYLNIF